MTDQSDIIRLMCEPPPADVKPLSLADIDEMLEAMFANARDEPAMMYISIERARQIRHMVHMAGLYRANPRPCGKLRKCHMRKLQARWRKGREHIRRVEQAEMAREESEMRRMREEREG